MNNEIKLNLTNEQQNALTQYAIMQILEEKMESEIDKEISKIHAKNKK